MAIMASNILVNNTSGNGLLSVRWIGLDLFNDDTRPSGHISRPAQVNVSQSGFHFLNNYSSLIILYTSGG